MNETFLFCAFALIYGLSLVVVYKQGMRDAKDEKPPQKPILPPVKKKERPMSEEEKAALDKQRRIEEYKG